jgi:hypothetical protein
METENGTDNILTPRQAYATELGISLEDIDVRRTTIRRGDLDETRRVVASYAQICFDEVIRLLEQTREYDEFLYRRKTGAEDGYSFPLGKSLIIWIDADGDKSVRIAQDERFLDRRDKKKALNVVFAPSRPTRFFAVGSTPNSPSSLSKGILGLLLLREVVGSLE